MSEEQKIPSRLSSPKSYHSASSPSASLRARLDTMLLNAEVDKLERDREREEFRGLLTLVMNKLVASDEVSLMAVTGSNSDPSTFIRKETSINRRSADLEKPEPAEVSLQGTSQMEIPMKDEAIVHYTQATVSDSPSNVLMKQVTNVVTDVEFLQEIYEENKAPEPKGYEKK